MRRVGRLFFPLRETLGFDARELTPTVVLRITVLAAETRSFERAEKTARDGAGLEVSAKAIHVLGAQRAAHGLPGVSPSRNAGHDRLEGIAGQRG